MVRKRIIDWEGIEREYRAGIKTHREIASEFNVSHGAIQKKAKQFEWCRDLTNKIRAKALDKVARIEVAKKIAKASEKDIIESVAQTQAIIVIQERKIIDATSDRVQRLEKEFDEWKEDTEKKARTLKIIVDMREKQINLKRRAWNISDNANGDADTKEEITRIELVAPNVNCSN